MPGKFELKKGKSGKFSFNLKAVNGQVILTSQTYKTKAAAKNGIKSVCTNCKKKTSFEQKVSKKGEPYFVMLAANKARHRCRMALNPLRKMRPKPMLRI
jgi:uncharacterized protein YegP (UPF0339 family)